MDNNSLEILKENLSALNLSLKRLLYSYEICKKTGIKETYSEEEFVVFEAMTSRYARTTDMLMNKVLRSLDVVEFIDGGTVIDAANNAEKRDIADSRELRMLKDLRNSIAHEYITENIVHFFDETLEFTPLLKIVIERLNAYCTRYLGENDK
jgi:tRNA C32,U32 (ribose-2'-O)-methylase TrmJ